MSTTPPDKAAESLLRTIWPVPIEAVPLPISPVSIAAHLGIAVYRSSFKDPNVSGMLVKRHGSDPQIHVNRSDHENRTRFTCAHEIGHYVSRAESDSDNWAYVDRRDSMSSTGTDSDEVYANRFAAELLMPAARVKHEWRRNPTKAALAVKFGVSVEAMGHRLKNLGIRER